MIEDLVSRQALATNDYVFEVNGVLCGIDTCLKKFETRMYVDLPAEAKTWTGKIKIDKLREHIFKECETLNESDTVSMYKAFYHDLTCTESYKYVYRHFYPHNMKCTPMAVLVTKGVALIEENLRTSFQDLVSRLDYTPEGDRVYRLNTDFLFFRLSEQSMGQDVATLVKKKYIERDPVRVCWSVLFEQQYYKANSFVGAFAILRALMRFHEKDPVVEGVDLARFDTYIF